MVTYKVALYCTVLHCTCHKHLHISAYICIGIGISIGIGIDNVLCFFVGGVGGSNGLYIIA